MSNLLGHSTFTLTLDVYIGDYMPEEDGGAVNNLPEPPAPAKPAKAGVVLAPELATKTYRQLAERLPMVLRLSAARLQGQPAHSMNLPK